MTQEGAVLFLHISFVQFAEAPSGGQDISGLHKASGTSSPAADLLTFGDSVLVFKRVSLASSDLLQTFLALAGMLLYCDDDFYYLYAGC